MKFGRLRLRFLQPINHNISFMCSNDTAKRQPLRSVLCPCARALSERENSMKLRIQTSSFMASPAWLDMVQRKDGDGGWLSGQSNNSRRAVHIVRSLLLRDLSSSAGSCAYVHLLTLHARNSDAQIAVTCVLAPKCNT